MSALRRHVQNAYVDRSPSPRRVPREKLPEVKALREAESEAEAWYEERRARAEANFQLRAKCQTREGLIEVGFLKPALKRKCHCTLLPRERKRLRERLEAGEQI